MGKDITIRMVKLSGDYESYAKSLAPIVFWKEVDAMITLVEDGDEHPLILLEFSTAVFTEDHELQRFDGLVAAAKNNCIYVKISPSSKTSPSQHGGNINFDFAGPYSLILRKWGKIFFHFDWKCNENGVVQVQENFTSCPKPIEEFDLLVNRVFSEILTKGFSENWAEGVYNKLLSNRNFEEWMNRLKNTPETDLTSLNTSRTRWLRKDDILGAEALELKLNRFGHAMDPERGMLAYYGRH